MCSLNRIFKRRLLVHSNQRQHLTLSSPEVCPCKSEIHPDPSALYRRILNYLRDASIMLIRLGVHLEKHIKRCYSGSTHSCTLYI